MVWEALKSAQHAFLVLFKLLVCGQVKLCFWVFDLELLLIFDRLAEVFVRELEHDLLGVQSLDFSSQFAYKNHLYFSEYIWSGNRP